MAAIRITLFLPPPLPTTSPWRSVAMATSMVRFTSSGRSRAIAACHASRPRPGTSQIASTGIAAPIAMLTDAAARAINCGPAAGSVCPQNPPFADAARPGRLHMWRAVSFAQQVLGELKNPRRDHHHQNDSASRLPAGTGRRSAPRAGSGTARRRPRKARLTEARSKSPRWNRKRQADQPSADQADRQLPQRRRRAIRNQRRIGALFDSE